LKQDIIRQFVQVGKQQENIGLNIGKLGENLKKTCGRDKIGQKCIGNCLIGLDLAGQKGLGAHSVNTRPESQELDGWMLRYVRIGSGTPKIKGFGMGNSGLLVKE
jgi:hypothetical protein